MLTLIGAKLSTVLLLTYSLGSANMTVMEKKIGFSRYLRIFSKYDRAKKRLNKLIADAVDAGKTPAEITKDISGLYKSWTTRRARVIARTETSAAYDAGSIEIFDQIGVEKVDMVGCQDAHEPWDCNKTGFTIQEAKNLILHPNHSGTLVPSNL